jgi:hypothetical protein
MLPTYRPHDIPLHFFYFGYKKALHYLKNENAIFDPIEVEIFEQNLHKNLLMLKKMFIVGYKTDHALAYLLPKSKNQNGEYRARPMVQFSFRDQIAWATVMLVLGEWFDSSEEIANRIPIHKVEVRQNYLWMVPWSFNNRIKRIHQKEEEEDTNELKRLFIHYNHSEMYESFQWGLRNLRETRKNHFENIRNQFGNAYYGEMDIKEFYPTLRKKYIILNFESP